MKVLNPSSISALALAAAACLSQPAHAEGLRAPAVPFDLRVPDGNVPFLKGAATGTQNYACTTAGNGFAWVLFTPEATLFNRADKQTITHFFGPDADPRDPNTDPRVVAAGRHSRCMASTGFEHCVGQSLSAVQTLIRSQLRPAELRGLASARDSRRA